MAAAQNLIKILGPVLERVFGLPAPRVRTFRYQPDQRVPMPDGITLATDLYRPSGIERGPVALVRTPYNKDKALSVAYGVLGARRGLTVVVQDVRGCFGSEGEFEPFEHERADGAATLDWLRQQPWCDGRVATMGASYLGHTQWAIGPYADPPLSAMALAITTADFGPSFYPGGAMSLWTVLSWSSLIGTQDDELSPLARLTQQRRVREAMNTLPVVEGDVAAIGKHVPFLTAIAEHAEPGDDHWSAIGHDRDLESLNTPVSMITGWHDVFVDRQLRDFTRLQQAGAEVRLTVGPWWHGQPTSLPMIFRDQLEFLDGHLLNDQAALQRSPVRLYLQAAKQWLDFDRWPAPTDDQEWALGVGGGIAPGPGEAGARAFIYDPADPTPTVGGPILAATAGQKDNATVEARPDVLIYTSDPLTEDLDVIGEIGAEVYVRTDHENADVYVRVCDVEPSGRSLNVTEQIHRLRPEDRPIDDLGTRAVNLSLWPTAYRFRAGHRIRVQISGGAMPTFARNHQTGEPVTTAVKTVSGRTQVLHGSEFPTRLILPIFG